MAGSPTTSKLLRALDARESELRERMAARREVSEAIPDAIESTGDLADMAFGRERAEVEQDLAERSLRELEGIAAARERVAEGTYGECVGCGTSIPPARLEVNLTALRCASCQETHEKQDKGGRAY